MNIPLVSICMITYNHEHFIREAIEGVLMQEVDFPVEFLIADDFSPDGTREIVDQYIQNHPNGNWIRYVRHSQNKGMMGNFVWALESCKGKYIALCEGDDFWTDPFKLQNQVEFLEADSNIVLCYHPVNVLMPDGNLKADFITEKNFKSDESGLYDLALFGNYIHTPSVVFKNVIQTYPQYFKELKVGDFFLYLILARKGSFCRLTTNSAVYRFGVGSFTSLSHTRMRLSFKYSLKVFLENENDLFVKIIFWLRFHQDKLYNTSKIYCNSNHKWDLIKKIRILTVFKALIKYILRIETNLLKNESF